MYYNSKYKIIHMILLMITLISSIYFLIKHDFRYSGAFILITLGLQQIVLACNSFKLEKRIESIFNLVISVFLLIISIEILVS